MSEQVFGERVRRARTGLGFSQRELAAKLGIARATVSSYESGAREPSFEVAQKIAATLGVSINYLFGCTDDPRGTESVERLEAGRCPIYMEILEYLESMSLAEQEEVLRFVRFRVTERESLDQKVHQGVRGRDDDADDAGGTSG
jgi:transcriptional regulator with XRE-family HTH domain